MKKQPSLFARIVRTIVTVVGIMILALYIGLPVGMAVAALLPARAGVGEPPAGFSEVTLQAQDGVQLAAWYRAPENGSVILLLHGAGGSRESMRPYAQMLAAHGYGVLAVDLRGHGASQGKTNRLGWQGTLDVGAALAFLQQRPEVQHIGGLGSSMGGEVLLGAASSYPDLHAIVADGATRRCTQEYLALPANRSLVHSFTTRVMYAAVQLFSGDQPPQPPLLASMQQSEAGHFLLIAAGNNALETAFNRLFGETLGARAVVWEVPGVDHTGAFAAQPAEYEKQVTAFFASALK